MHSGHILEVFESRRLLSAAVVDGILTIHGTEGNDIVAVESVLTELQVTINGGTPEVFPSDGVNGILCFGGGNDNIAMAVVNLPTTVHGGFGDDSISINGNGNAEIFGGEGNDTITGGDGNDVVSGKDGFDLINGGLGNDLLNGGGKADVINGNDGMDTINGGAGDDSLSGGGKADVINGNDGADSLYGGAGNDTLFGGGKADLLHGQFGDDSLIGGAGNDAMYGDDDNDTFNALDDFNFFADTVEGSFGIDTGSFDPNDTFLEDPVVVA